MKQELSMQIEFKFLIQTLDKMGMSHSLKHLVRKTVYFSAKNLMYFYLNTVT